MGCLDNVFICTTNGFSVPSPDLRTKRIGDYLVARVDKNRGHSLLVMTWLATVPSDEGDIALVCSEDFAQAPERLWHLASCKQANLYHKSHELFNSPQHGFGKNTVLEMFRRAKPGCNFVIDKMTKAFDAKMADKAMRDDSSDSDDGDVIPYVGRNEDPRLLKEEQWLPRLHSSFIALRGRNFVTGGETAFRACVAGPASFRLCETPACEGTLESDELLLLLPKPLANALVNHEDSVHRLIQAKGAAADQVAVGLSEMDPNGESVVVVVQKVK